MTANLISPLLINPERRLGKQTVIDKPHYSSQHPIISGKAGIKPQAEL
jgi:flagellar assembly factor FliW